MCARHGIKVLIKCCNLLECIYRECVVGINKTIMFLVDVNLQYAENFFETFLADLL